MNLEGPRRVSITRFAVLGTVGLTLSSAASAFGQTPATPPPPPPRLEASAQFSFLNTSGNASSRSLGAGADLAWRPDPWTHTAKVTFAQTESDEELTARSIAAAYRASRVLRKRLEAWGQYDFLRDVFAGVEQRHVVESGLSYLVVDAAPQTLRFDVGLGYLHEKQPTTSIDSATVLLGAAYRVDISPTSFFTYAPRFLLPLSDSDSWKFDQDTALTLTINQTLAVKLSHTLRYSHHPAAGFKTTDTVLGVSLVAKIQRPK